MTTEPPTHDDDSNEQLLRDAKDAIEATVGADEYEPVGLKHIDIPGYKIERRLSEGGQGAVYLAIRVATRSRVAIKVLLHGPHASKAAQRRFEREVELASQLSHPNIIAVFDSGVTAEGLHFYVMDYVRGQRLHTHVHDKNLSLEETLDLFKKICDAVQYAHHRGVIHRDLKPSNILVDTEGNPKILDFGLAKLMSAPVDTILSITRDVIGTLPYMSPEQARGESGEIDARTDIYSLGIILYELLTGHFPYPVAGHMAEVLRNITEKDPDPISKQWKSDSGITKRSGRKTRSTKCPIDREVELIVLKSLEKERKRRYQSCGELAKDLERYLAGDPISPIAPSIWYILRKKAGRHRARLATAGVVVLLGVCTVLVIYTFRVREMTRQAEIEAESKSLAADGAKSAVLDKWDDAIKFYQDALELNPRQFRALCNLAILWKDRYFETPKGTITTDRLTEAIDLIDRAIAIKPERADMFNVKAVVLYALGRLPEAEEACHNVLDVLPDYYPAESNLAKVLALQHRIDEALKAGHRGIEAATRKGVRINVWTKGVWQALATIQLHLGKEEAATSIDNSIKSEASHGWAYIVRAKLRLTLPRHIDHGQALDDAKIAVAVADVADARLERVLAWAHLRNGHYAEAVDHAKEALALDGQKTPNQLIMAIAHAKLGEQEAAQASFDRAKQAFPLGLTQETPLVNADRGQLWFDSYAEWKAFEKEAEALLNPTP